jgi:hypothetical protein
MYQSYPSTGQQAGPLRPPPPAPVRTAIKLKQAGVAVWTVILIGALVLLITGNKAGHATINGHVLTAARASQLKPVLITVAVRRPQCPQWSPRSGVTSAGPVDS